MNIFNSLLTLLLFYPRLIEYYGLCKATLQKA